MNNPLKIILTGALMILTGAIIVDTTQLVAIPICLFILGGITGIFGPLVYGAVKLNNSDKN